jgi:hypothetical protein
MLGKKANLAAPPAAGGLYAVFEIDTDQDVASWSVQGFVFDPDDPTVTVKSLSVSLNATTKQITAKLSSADCDALLNGGTDDVIYGYVIRVNPDLSPADYLRFFYGELKIIAGGPDDVANTPSPSPSSSPSSSPSV